MKVLIGTLLVMAVLLVAAGCKKSSPGNDVGLFGTKQYHEWVILSVSDTAIQPNTKITTQSENHNYLAWNGILMHINTPDNDTLVTYIQDTAENGNTVILYTLNYYPKQDSVVVYDCNPTTRYWRSYK